MSIIAKHATRETADGFGDVARDVAPTVERSRNRSLRARGARLFAQCAMGAWVLLAVTPVIVVLCAIG